MTDQRTLASDATVSSDYDGQYYGEYGAGHLGAVPYTYDEPQWKAFFGGIADQMVALFEPSTFYDAGCAKGFLVRAMAELDVDARGGDISAHAIEGAPPGLAERLEVKDLTEPFDDRFDLISCIEVLEHMSAADARTAIRNLCDATDLILMSSTPDDFAEPTHVNVRPPAEWAQDFAARGFFRRTDIDASFVAPWAVVYQRAKFSAVQVVGAYEVLLAPLSREVVAKRRALLESQRDLSEARSPVNAAVSAARDELNRVRAELTGQLDLVVADRDRLAVHVENLGLADLQTERMNRLAMADELVGLRAELAQVRVHAENAVVEAGREAVRLREVLAATQSEFESARAGLAAADSTLSEFRTSAAWRIGRTVTLPMRIIRLPVRLARGVARRARRYLRR